MDSKTIVAGVLMDENTTVSFVEICQKCNISEEILGDMIEHGLFGGGSIHISSKHVDSRSFGRIQSACRLQQDLGINVPGVILVLELLDELQQLRNEINILNRHVGDQ